MYKLQTRTSLPSHISIKHIPKNWNEQGSLAQNIKFNLQFLLLLLTMIYSKQEFFSVVVKEWVKKNVAPNGSKP